MRIKFALAVLLQMLLLLAIIANRQYLASTGERILLKTTPVDPRSIFRGDYVVLSYDISSLNLDDLGVAQTFKRGQTVYVELEQREGSDTCHAVSICTAERTCRLVIKGRVKNFFDFVLRYEVIIRDDTGRLRLLEPRWIAHDLKKKKAVFCIDKFTGSDLVFDPADQYQLKNCRDDVFETGMVEDMEEVKYKRLDVDYGIDSYFVEEGRGKYIEAARNASQLKVEIALSPSGTAVITGMVLDGRIVR